MWNHQHCKASGWHQEKPSTRLRGQPLPVFQAASPRLRVFMMTLHPERRVCRVRRKDPAGGVTAPRREAEGRLPAGPAGTGNSGHRWVTSLHCAPSTASPPFPGAHMPPRVFRNSLASIGARLQRALLSGTRAATRGVGPRVSSGRSPGRPEGQLLQEGQLTLTPGHSGKGDFCRCRRGLRWGKACARRQPGCDLHSVTYRDLR